MPEGLYLYCLASASLRLPAEEMSLDGHSPLDVAYFQDIAAVWSAVALGDFVGREAAARLQDLAWVGPRIMHHQEVVAGVMASSPVLPLRFGTIFSSRERLVQVLRQHHDLVASFLGAMTGREEWSVKALWHRKEAREKAWSLMLAREASQLQALAPGARYFQEKRLRTECDQQVQRWLGDQVRDLLIDLRTHAEDFRERRLRPLGEGNGASEMIKNWAFLAPRKPENPLRACVEAANSRYRERGLELLLSGPWPPYSFCPALDLTP